eukprot:INCI18172.1.p1 GENE.INCI18172.1~~INCI18172.1.p1  ORF type:complete len:584 (+),score=79.99 INCI18172.1:177-1928(+)
MEFPFSISQNLNRSAPSGSIVAVTARSLQELSRDGQQNAKAVLDVFGERSARAQKLKGPITSFSKILGASDQVLYMQHEGNKALGFIKVGKRRLFIHHQGRMKEIVPLCVLDFYVHESCQRMGVGSKLFRHMLARHAVHPSKLAYDRPSPKLIAFLRKYYNLTEFDKQNNNYVVFHQYFRSSNESDPAADTAGEVRNGRESLSQRPLTARDRFGRKIKKNGGGKRKVKAVSPPKSIGALPGLNPLVTSTASSQVGVLPGVATQARSPNERQFNAVQSAAQRSDLRKQQELRMSPMRSEPRGGVSSNYGALPSLRGAAPLRTVHPVVPGGKSGFGTHGQAIGGIGASSTMANSRSPENIQDLLRAAREENAFRTGYPTGSPRGGGSGVTSSGFDALARHTRKSPSHSPFQAVQSYQAKDQPRRNAETTNRGLGRLSPLNNSNYSGNRRGSFDGSKAIGSPLGFDLGRQKPTIIDAGGGSYRGAHPGLQPLSPSSLRRSNNHGSQIGVGGSSFPSPLRSKLSPLAPGLGTPQGTQRQNNSVAAAILGGSGSQHSTYNSPLGTAMPRYSSEPRSGGVVGSRQRLLF